MTSKLLPRPLACCHMNPQSGYCMAIKIEHSWAWLLRLLIIYHQRTSPTCYLHFETIINRLLCQQAHKLLFYYTVVPCSLSAYSEKHVREVWLMQSDAKKHHRAVCRCRRMLGCRSAEIGAEVNSWVIDVSLETIGWLFVVLAIVGTVGAISGEVMVLVGDFDFSRSDRKIHRRGIQMCRFHQFFYIKRKEKM